MLEMDTPSEILDINFILTQLITQEVFMHAVAVIASNHEFVQ
jgi:hypothetical protein